MLKQEPTPCPECGADFCHVHQQEQAASQLPDLKPCPFCGGPADLSYCEFSYPLGRLYSVLCTSCTAVMTDKSERNAVLKWNQRQEVFPQDQDSKCCATCQATLELGQLFCSQCRTTSFSQFLEQVSLGKEIPLHAPGRSL